MNNPRISEAVENISFIKDIIEKTKDSFHTLSKIFIIWSVIFLLHGIWGLMFSTFSSSPISTTPIFANLMVNFLFILLATGVLLNVTKKTPLLGLEKHVLLIWILILTMIFLPIRFNLSTSDTYYVITRTGHYTTLLCGLGVGLIITRLFTNIKALLITGVIFILLGYSLAFVELSLLSYLSYILLPATFLYTGILLKKYSNKELD